MSNPTQWWWVRHAPVVGYDGRLYGQTDVPCDTSDSKAFRCLAETLPADAAWVVTHLSRTARTAAAIADAGMTVPEPAVEPDLAEQFFGDWQGLTWDEMKIADADAYETFWEEPADNAPPGGESFAAVIERTAAVIERLNAAHAGRDIVAVTHGGTIRAALAVALDLTPARALGLRIDNLSLSRVEHIPDGFLRGHGGAWRVTGMNVPPRASP
jgi:alpha-ribazole phosphatase